MVTIGQILAWIGNLFRWWVVVLPWEIALRVRFGKHVTPIRPGLHLRIPLIDAIFKQTSRLRIVSIPLQTITTRDNKTITIMAVFGYEITDLLTLYRTLHRPEGTVSNMVMSEIAQYVGTHDLSESTPAKIEASIASRVDISKFGLGSKYVKIVGYAVVKTYRILNDQHYGMFDSLEMEHQAGGGGLPVVR